MVCEVHACSMLMMHAAACTADVFTPVLGCSWRQSNTYRTLFFQALEAEPPSPLRIC